MVGGEFDVIDRDSNVFIFSYVYDNGLGSCASAFFLSTLRVIEYIIKHLSLTAFAWFTTLCLQFWLIQFFKFSMSKLTINILGP